MKSMNSVGQKNGLRSLFVAVAIGCFVSSARADEFHILNGVDNWCVGESYAEDAVPDAGDVVFIGPGTNVTLKASDAASWAKFNEIARVVPLGGDSKLFVEVSSGTAELTKPFTAFDYVKYNVDVQKYGCLVKTGAGELKLSGLNSLSQTGSVFDYTTGLSVEGGTLTMTPRESFSSFIYVGRVDVAAGATFNVPYATVANYSVFVSYGFNGLGTIANPGSGHLVYLRTQGNAYDPGCFGGKVTGSFARGVVDNGYQSFKGVTSDATGQFELITSYLGVETFGASEAESSLGKVKALDFSGAGILEYLGNGTAEEPDDAGKQINFNLSAGSATVSAGNGGVRFTGAWANKNANLPNQNVILSGTNTTPAYLANPLAGPWSGTAGTAQNLTLEKEGAGVWRLQSVKGRFNAGVTAVREGTLQIDDAEERVRMSAMGLATNLCDLTTGAAVSHAIELGSTNAMPAAEAILEYTGAKGVAVSTRPIGLVGKGGHFRNNSSTAVVRWAGASALTPGSNPVLTLDGSSTKTNEMADIVNGAGTVSVCKEGTGTWRLSGDLAFSGALDVKQGKLLVRKIVPANYDWYRWTIRGLMGGNDWSANIYLEEWGLFDADGYRQNLSPTVLDVSYADLEPGQAAFGTTRKVNMRNGEDSLKRLFDASCGAQGRFEPLAPGYEAESGYDSWMTPWAGHPETELSVVQRLAADKSAAFSWDYMPIWGGASAPDRMTLEASVDGLHWETLDRVDPETTTLYIEASGNSQKWVFSGILGNVNCGSATKPYTDGRPLAKQASTKSYAVFPTDASPTVSVAPEAELEAETSGIVISKLAVLPSGMGVIKGFDLAAGGTIDIVSEEKLEPGRIPFNFSGTATACNLSDWSVTVNGTVPRGYMLTPSADGIDVRKTGLMLIFR